MGDNSRDDLENKMKEVEGLARAYSKDPAQGREKLRAAYAGYQEQRNKYEMNRSRDRAKVGEQIREHWRNLLGDRLDSMLSSRSVTEQMLADPNPQVREGALLLIGVHWKPGATSEDIFRTMALNDSEPKVRIAALQCWGSLHKGDKNELFSAALAAIIKDQSNTPLLRSTAYVCLCETQETEKSSLTQFVISMCRNPESVPETLDWNLVGKF